MESLNGEEDHEDGDVVKVQTTIEHMLLADDPIDRPDFNAVDYINALFPSEQSLSNIDDVLNRMKQKIRYFF